ncbi:unnamed protein product, partial [Amoebophrya sp. A25]
NKLVRLSRDKFQTETEKANQYNNTAVDDLLVGGGGNPRFQNPPYHGPNPMGNNYTGAARGRGAQPSVGRSLRVQPTLSSTGFPRDHQDQPFSVVNFRG